MAQNPKLTFKKLIELVHAIAHIKEAAYQAYVAFEEKMKDAERDLLKIVGKMEQKNKQREKRGAKRCHYPKP